ncbi:MAG: HEAT repeat domain-containing protein [Ignavibacteriales bacterium]|nr:HEAT repeat domain-containing protein [Ignavibacteriales bacterium]MBP9120844.1 HEAT repeat domain-containing protein [Ignavibacterium sp.]
MKTKIFLNCLLVISISISSFGFIKQIPAKVNNYNRDLVIENLLNGVNSGNHGLRMSSAYFLGEIKADEAVIPLMKILKNDQNEEARIMAALSLLKIGDLRGLFAIKRTIQFDDSERVKKMCSIFYQDYISNK